MSPDLSKLPATLLTGLLIFLAFNSCKKDAYEVGLGLLPPTDTLNVKSTDTCTVEAFSMIQDSTRTDKTSTLLLGSIVDPVFGKTTSSFYTQFRLSSEGVDFGDHPVLDSLVLMLVYSSHYGDTLTRQNVRVYEISDDFSYDSIYYSTRTLRTYPTLLADQDYVPNLTDSVSVFGTKVAPHLRINLSKLTHYLGNKILQAPASTLALNTSFIKFMKGLYVQSTPVDAKGAIMRYSIANGVSKMVVYYHNGDNPSDDSLHYDVLINESCGRFTHIDHNGFLDANPYLKQQIINRDSALGTKQIFVEGMAGVKVKIKFPFMKNFRQGRNIAINEAILELTNAESDTTYAPPASLIMFRQDSIGRVAYLIDAGEGTSYSGGTYNAATRKYSFRLTQHMQRVIQERYANHFDLYLVVNNPISNTLTPNRVILEGTKPPAADRRIRLKLNYTVLH